MAGEKFAGGCRLPRRIQLLAVAIVCANRLCITAQSTEESTSPHRSTGEGSISGRVWIDADRDGLPQSGEPGRAGCTVYVDLNASGRIDEGEPTAETDAFGVYSITNVPAGVWFVATQSAFGWELTAPSVRHQGSDNAMEFVEAVQDGEGGAEAIAGARSLAISPDGMHVYVAASRDNAVTVFRRSLSDGTLAFVQALVDGQGGITTLGGASAVVVSPDGQHVYASSSRRNAPTGAFSVTSFSRDPTSGCLTLLASSSFGSSRVFDIAVTDDGGSVYFAWYMISFLKAYMLTSLVRSSTSGELTWAQTFSATKVNEPLFGLSAVATSSDGRHVYAASSLANCVQTYDRSSVSGLLTRTQILWDGTNGVTGLRGVSDITVSTDGANVYASGRADSAVVVFTRDATNGQLTATQVLRDGVGGIDGISNASAVAVSPDGRRVYVAGAADKALTEFRRDLSTGTLTFMDG